MSNAAQEQTVTQLPAIRKDREVRVVSDPIPVLDTARFEHMQRIATVMAKCGLVPDSLKGKDQETAVANCFLVVNQSIRWGMDPFAVAQCASVIHGKLCYEGKLVAAVMQTHGVNLSFELNKQTGDAFGVIVIGTLPGENKPRTITGTVGQWKTTNEQWKKDPAAMLCYRGARAWSRIHNPAPMLGVYTPEELEEMRDVTPSRDDGPPAPPSKTVPEIASRPSDIELVEAGRDNGQQVVWDETTGEIKEPGAFDEAQWLKDLEGALGGCNDFASLAEKQGAIMMPEKSRASAEGWAKAKALISASLDRINNATAEA